MKLSIIIPCYNESRTIVEIIQRVLAIDLGLVKKEILVIDDGSTDSSATLVQQQINADASTIRLFKQPRNRGKGAAMQRGFKEATGDLVVIQDADLEYDPADWQQMIPLFRLPQIDVVFGSRRLLPGNPTSGLFFYWGAQLINLFTNILYGARISDQFTCYKMARREVVRHIPLHSQRFAIDAELTAKLLRLGRSIQEVPITYHPRSQTEGKKIRFRDGVSWLWQIIKYRFADPRG